MNINALALGQSPVPEPSPAATVGTGSGFAQVIGNIQSGAPPGASPPPTAAAVGEGVAIIGPIAQSLNRDFLPQGGGSTQGSSQGTTRTVKADGAPGAKKEARESQVEAFDPTLAEFAQIMLPTASLAVVPTLQAGAAASSPIAADGGGVQVDPSTMIAQASAAATVFPDALETPVNTTGISLPTAAPTMQPHVPAEQEPIPSPSAGYASQALTHAVPHHDPVQDPGNSDGGGKPVETAAPTIQASTTSVQVEATPIRPNVRANEAGTLASARPKRETVKTAAVDGPVATPGASDAEDDVLRVTAKSSKLDVDADSDQDVPTAEPQATSLAPRAQSVDLAVEKPRLKATDLNLVVRQIADKMELLAATRPKNGITIMLQPERLGSITMTIKSLAGSVEAHIKASDENVRTALEQNRAMLGQALSEKGLKLDAVSIAAQTRDSTTSQQQTQNQQHGQHQAHGRPAQNSMNQPHAGSAVPMTVQQKRQQTRSVDGVDLWI